MIRDILATHSLGALTVFDIGDQSDTVSSTLNKNQKPHKDTGPVHLLSSLRAKACCDTA